MMTNFFSNFQSRSQNIFAFPKLKDNMEFQFSSAALSPNIKKNENGNENGSVMLGKHGDPKCSTLLKS